MSNAIDQEMIPARYSEVVAALCEVAADLSHLIRRGALGGRLGAEMGTNTDGDGQKALDIMADEAFAAALAKTDIRHYASEEREGVETLNPAGTLALAIDPLDGSSNIDVNVSIGTIFAIFEAKDDPEQSFLRSAREQVAAGYVIYGPQTSLAVTFGAGTQLYTLDPDSGRFVLVERAVQISEDSKEFAINASNHRHWSAPVRAYIDDCLSGEEGPRERNYNMRWVASLVAETHRILTRGGLFLYPSDSRKGYERGRLRRVYECSPIAFVIEQAKGKATDGANPILDATARKLHERSPLIFGSASNVDRVAGYHHVRELEVSALFKKRSLFRN